MNTHDENVSMAHDCQQRESKLTENEAKFIADIIPKLDKGWTLTEKQEGWLTKIWERIT